VDLAETHQHNYKLRGNLGILAAKLRPEAKVAMRKKLRLVSRGWKGEPPTEVMAYHDDGDYFWVPRFYFPEAPAGYMGSHSVEMEWSEGQPCNLVQGPTYTLDPQRGQPLALERMVAHLKQASGGMLLAPTGCGKTILGYAIAQQFGVSIGVLVYNAHMMKNWVETAQEMFGLTSDQVGIVQSDRCDLGRPITVMMIESLIARRYPDELYKQIGFICADECHRYGAPHWNAVMRIMPARYRLGLSADPHRTDGLDKLIGWHFGQIAHRVVMDNTPKPDVVQLKYDFSYPETVYQSFNGALNDGEGGWEPDPIKYDRMLQNDPARNALIVDELVQARVAGRRILVFARTRKHLDRLADEFTKAMDGSILRLMVDESVPMDGVDHQLKTKTTLLVGGLKSARLEEAMTGDVIFTTTVFSREALNLPHIDTLVFATPPGKALQPIGRLRDKGPADRRPLLAIDIYEPNEYSAKRAKRRGELYQSLGMRLIRKTRNPPILTKRKKSKSKLLGDGT